MINGIGPTGTGRIETGRTNGAAKPAAPSVRTAGSESVTNPAAELAALGAPVDAAKVEAIRTAIAEGRYSIDPKAIADKMIALDLPGQV